MREEGEEGAFRGQGALVAQVRCQAHKWEIMCTNWEFQIRQKFVSRCPWIGGLLIKSPNPIRTNGERENRKILWLLDMSR